eukprot:Filipodium_phascolosomae@DN1245_c1_g1_i1.p1
MGNSRSTRRNVDETRSPTSSRNVFGSPCCGNFYSNSSSTKNGRTLSQKEISQRANNLVDAYYRKNPNVEIVTKDLEANKDIILSQTSLKPFVVEFIRCLLAGIEVGFVLDDGAVVKGSCRLSDDWTTLVLQVRDKCRELKLKNLSDVYEGGDLIELVVDETQAEYNKEHRATAVFSSGTFVTLDFPHLRHRELFLCCSQVVGESLTLEEANSYLGQHPDSVETATSLAVEAAS